MRILQGLLILIILWLQIRLWSGPGSLAEISRLNEAISDQESENAALDSRNRELLTEVEELKSGTEVIEEMAREDLGLIKEGETFYMIVEPEKSRQADANNQAGRED
jgi:cell division protein FtsB